MLVSKDQSKFECRPIIKQDFEIVLDYYPLNQLVSMAWALTGLLVGSVLDF